MIRPRCADCHNEIDPQTCWCGDDMSDHRGMSHNHSFVAMGCKCGYVSAPPRQMVSLDLLTQSGARPLKWFRNWDAAFSTDDFQVVYRSDGPIFNRGDWL